MVGQDCQFPRYAIRRESCSDVGGDAVGGVGAAGVGSGGGFPAQWSRERPHHLLKNTSIERRAHVSENQIFVTTFV